MGNTCDVKGRLSETSFVTPMFIGHICIVCAISYMIKPIEGPLTFMRAYVDRHRPFGSAEGWDRMKAWFVEIGPRFCIYFIYPSLTAVQT